MIKNIILLIAAVLPSFCFAEIIEVETELNRIKYDYDPSTKTAVAVGGTVRIWQLLIPGTISVEGEEIPVVAIASGAFQDNEIVTSLKVGSSVTKIESKAIDACPNLKTLDLVESSEPIMLADDCFGDCPLTNLYLNRPLRGEGMSMSVKAFVGNPNLESLTIHENVECLTSGMFADCPALYFLDIYDSATPLSIDADVWPQSNIQRVSSFRNLTFPTGNPFAGSESLERISLGFSMTHINPGLLKGCKNTRRIILIQGIEEIGDDAFNGCPAINRIELPETVTEIGASAFAGCTGLTTVTVAGSIPPSASENTFDAATYSTARLLVPSGLEESYKAAPCWKNFNTVMADPETGIDDISSGDKTPVGYISLSGIRSTTPVKGEVNIVVFDDGTAGKVLH